MTEEEFKDLLEDLRERLSFPGFGIIDYVDWWEEEFGCLLSILQQVLRETRISQHAIGSPGIWRLVIS